MHPSTTKMYRDLRDVYWWSGMKQEVADFVLRCLTCQQVKAEHRRPAGLLQSIEIPEWKWKRITIDFVTGLPRTRKGYDSVWVIVDRLTKTTHFILVKTSHSSKQYAHLYIDEIVCLHGVPVSIISDRGTQFTYRFWRSVQEALGTQLHLSTAFHPQTDGQSERTIQTLEDMLRACVIDFRGSWDRHISLMEFAYNNSYHSSIQMAPFEALYGRRCRSPIGWFDLGESKLLRPDFIRDATDKVCLIKDKLLAAQSRQKSYADPKRRELEFQVSDHVFLRVSPMKGVMRFGKKGKLSAVHPMFHISMLWKYIPDPSHVLEYERLHMDDTLSYDEQPMTILDRQVKRLRNKDIVAVKILWKITLRRKQHGNLRRT
ncbi:unnamed protein product [Rhodiola kirilowii]